MSNTQEKPSFSLKPIKIKSTLSNKPTQRYTLTQYINSQHNNSNTNNSNIHNSNIKNNVTQKPINEVQKSNSKDDDIWLELESFEKNENRIDDNKLHNNTEKINKVIKYDPIMPKVINNKNKNTNNNSNITTTTNNNNNIITSNINNNNNKISTNTVNNQPIKINQSKDNQQKQCKLKQNKLFDIELKPIKINTSLNKGLLTQSTPQTTPQTTPTKTLTKTHNNIINNTQNNNQTSVLPNKSTTQVIKSNDISTPTVTINTSQSKITTQKIQNNQQKLETHSTSTISDIMKNGGRNNITFGTFIITSPNELRIVFSSNRFNDIIQLFKDNNIQFTNTNTYISIQTKDYINAIELCKNRPLLKITSLPSFCKKLMDVPMIEDGDIERYSSIPNNIKEALYPFQKDGVEFGLRKKGRVLIADEMGLGKTIQAIALLSAYKEKLPALIITPNSLVYQWCDQLQKWLSIDDNEISIFTPKENIIRKTQFVIVSYESVLHSVGALVMEGFKIVVCDECHFLKSISTKRTNETIDICKRAQHIILLSGTPALSRPMELFPLLSILLNPMLSYDDFGNRYCKQTTSAHKKDYKGMINEEELNFILRRVMIRREKINVLTDLPQKIREKINIGKPRFESTLFKIMDDFKKAKTLTERRGGLFEIYRSTGVSKIPLVTAYIDDILKKEEIKFIVFAHHRDVIDGIVYFLQQKKIKFIRIDGLTKKEDRLNLVNVFKNDIDFRVAVLSIDVAACGLEFQVASLCVFAEMCFVPGQLKQAEDRIHRIGQVSTHVRIQYLIANDSFDEYIWNKIGGKLDVVGRVIDGVGGKLDYEVKDSLIDVTNDSDFVKGLLEVVKTYEERKKLNDENENIRKRQRNDDLSPSRKRTIEEINLFDNDDGEIGISKGALSKLHSFDFKKN